MAASPELPTWLREAAEDADLELDVPPRVRDARDPQRQRHDAHRLTELDLPIIAQLHLVLDLDLIPVIQSLGY